MGSGVLDGWRLTSGSYARKRHVIWLMQLGSNWGRRKATCVPNVAGGKLKEGVVMPGWFSSL
eukprot:9887550-Karenia_brevis.AAC.1